MKNPLACLTVVRNEDDYLPIWVRHYGSIPGANLFILDHESNPPVYVKNATVLPIRHSECENVHWLREMIESRVSALFTEYDRVIFAEVDEFLCPDPRKYSCLAEYLDKRRETFLTATGMNVCELSHTPPLGPNPLRERGWKRDDQYDKTLILKQPIRWEVGFHRPTSIPHQNPDPDLILVHMHYADREVNWRRIMARQVNKTVVQNGLGWQNKFQSRDQFDQHFSSAIAGADPIPDIFQELL